MRATRAFERTVAPALAAMGAFDEARDVGQDHGSCRVLVPVEGKDAQVWAGGRERVGTDLRAGRGQRRQERGLPGIRGPDEADVGDVVLAARVRAAGDVHPDPADLGEPGVVERLPDVGGEAARLGDREVAGVRARAAHDVAGELGTGFVQVDLA